MWLLYFLSGVVIGSIGTMFGIYISMVSVGNGSSRSKLGEIDFESFSGASDGEKGGKCITPGLNDSDGGASSAVSNNNKRNESESIK